MGVFDRNDEPFLLEHIAHADEVINDPNMPYLQKKTFEGIKRRCQKRLDAMRAGTPMPEK